ncbi:MAG: S-methyl-5'-thioadenosine phosphorylase [Labedaea sp.]
MDLNTDVGIIGGSGLYHLLENATEVSVSTPYGAPSDSLFVGDVGGCRVAFLPRHGRTHAVPPHQINYRANLWAMRSMGVRRVLAASAVGSLTAEHGPGTLVVPDQLVDRTHGRTDTFYDGLPRGDGRTPRVVHVAFADPYCPATRRVVVDTALSQGWAPVDGGTLVVINGPRFSTRAESRWFRSQGWSVVGMTGYPEAALARELCLCYTAVSLVTDWDSGAEVGDGVTHQEVLRVFADNVHRLRALLLAVVKHLPEWPRDCLCRTALDSVDSGLDLP